MNDRINYLQLETPIVLAKELLQPMTDLTEFDDILPVDSYFVVENL
jgi:hypothetical protein